MVKAPVDTSNEVKRAPGPRGRCLVGSMTDFRGDRLIGTMEHARDKYGDIVRFRVGPRTVHLISHPDIAREVLVREKGAFLKIQEGTDKKIGLGLVLGEGLLTNRDHESWFARRRILQPVFHRRRAAAMADEMAAAGQKMLSRWEELYAPKDVLDIHEEMMRVTLAVINRTMFGADVTQEASRVGTAMTILTRYAFAQAGNPFSVGSNSSPSTRRSTKIPPARPTASG